MGITITSQLRRSVSNNHRLVVKQLVQDVDKEYINIALLVFYHVYKGIHWW